MTEQRSEIPEIDVTTLTIDLNEITLGEMAAIEAAAGQDFLTVFGQGRASRRMIALFLREYRSSGSAPSWRELGNLRPRGAGSSTSVSPSAGTPAK